MCSRPWSIKIKTNDPTMGLAVGGQAVRACLTVGGPTCHPILAPPSTTAGCQKAVARTEMVFAHQLAIALEQALQDRGCSLWLMRYGMKIPAEEAFDKLMSCRVILEQEHGPLFAQKCWREKLVDFGTHSVLSMHPTLVFPMKNFHQLNWADWPASPWQGRSSLPKADIVFGEMDSSTKGNWNACFFCP